MIRSRRPPPTRLPPITLAPDDLATVQSMLSKGRWNARELRRARILLLLHQKRTVKEAGDAVGAYPHTVRQVGWRYVREGTQAALRDRARPGGKKLLTPSQRERVIAMVCGPPPSGRGCWTVRLVATEAVARGIVRTVGRETIRVLLASHDLKPWRKKAGA
jgi:transposase